MDFSSSRIHSIPHIHHRLFNRSFLYIACCILFFLCTNYPKTISATEPQWNSSIEDQSLNFKLINYTVKDGLAHNEIYTIFKDSKGEIWISTRLGIHKYDGNTFVRFSKEEFGLRNHYGNIMEDGEGKLWFTHKSVAIRPAFFDIFDPYTEKRVLMDQEQNYPFLFTDVVHVIPSAKKNTLYIHTKQNQVIEFVSKTDYKVINLEGDFLSYGNFWAQEREGEVFFTKGKFYPPTGSPPISLVTYNTQGQIVESGDLQKDQYRKAYFSNKSWEMITDFINIKKDTTINSFLRKNPTLILRHKDDIRAHSRITYDKDRGLFWYVKDNILVGFHPIYGIQEQFKLGDQTDLIRIHDILFLDQEMWISTYDNGIFHLSPIRFKTIRPTTNGQYRGMRKDKNGNLCVISDGHFLVLDTNLTLKKNIASGFGFSLLKDKASNIWHINNGELIKYDHNFNIVTRDSLDYYLNYQNIEYSWSLAEDSSGNIWFPYHRQLYYLDASEKIQKFDAYNEFESIKESIIYEIISKDKNHFWLCSTNGLYLLDLTKGIVARYWEGGEGSYYLPALDYRHLHIDINGVYWIATGDRGLIKWTPSFDSEDSQDYSIKQFTTFKGMPSNIMHGILEDKNGFLWISTENGLVQFHKRSYYFKVYTDKDGIDHNEFNRVSHYQDEEGTMYFGGIKGITLFNPDDFNVDSMPSPIGILSLKKYQDESYINHMEQYQSDGRIQFQEFTDQFILNFGSINPMDKEKHKYSYAFNNNTRWYPSVDNKITLNNLSYGSHKLYIQKENLAGKQIGLLPINITVPFPFYLQSWFLFFVVFLLLGGFYLAMKWRNQQYEKRQLALEKIVKERTQKIQNDKTLIEKQKAVLEHLNKTKAQFFNNLAHEIRNPLTLILGSVKVLEKRLLPKEDGKEYMKLTKSIQQNGTNILKLSEEVLALSKLESNPDQIQETPISLYLLMEKIISAFESTAVFQKKELELNYSFDKDLYLSLDVSKFEKIINNLISNALKYSSRGAVINISVSYGVDNILHVSVEDDGYGIEEKDMPFIFEPYFRSQNIRTIHDPLDAKGGIGIGLALVKKLIELLNGKITVVSQKDVGTTFILEFPVTKSTVKHSPILSNHKNGSTDIVGQVITSNREEIQRKIHHLLIVEDHFEIQQFIQSILEPYYKISLATDGNEAIAILSSNVNKKNELPISLIISDVMMPEMDGIQLLKNLKKNAIFKQLPFMFLTGYTNEETKIEALRQGVDDYLIKPFEPEELLAQVKNLLTYKEQRISFVKEEQVEVSQPTFEEEWVETLINVIQDNLNNHELNLDFLAQELMIGKRQLTRKVKLNTGLSPGKYIQEIRLQEARKLLEQKKCNSVNNVCYSVGFKTPNYFAKQFKLRFGRLPSSYFQ